jgi:hypothetical protein
MDTLAPATHRRPREATFSRKGGRKLKNSTEIYMTSAHGSICRFISVTTASS